MAIPSIQLFLLVLVRIASFMMTAPLFSYRSIPAKVKLSLALFLTIITVFTIDANTNAIRDEFLLLIIKESVIGLTLGFVAGLILYSVQMAGAFVDLQIGFAFAKVVDPQTGARTPLTGRYLYIFALLFMLAVNAHHMLLSGIFYSFQIVPVDALMVNISPGTVAHYVIELFTKVFLISFQIATPLVGCIFLTDVALGIIARTVPQVNVFVVGLPMKILISFLVLLIVLPIYITVFRFMFETMTQVMVEYMKVMGSK